MTDERNYNFDVETKQYGQLSPYATGVFHFIITDKSSGEPHNENRIRAFCVGVLRKGCEKNAMPNPFAGQILIFKKLGTRKWEYKVEEEYTG